MASSTEWGDVADMPAFNWGDLKQFDGVPEPPENNVVEKKGLSLQKVGIGDWADLKKSEEYEHDIGWFQKEEKEMAKLYGGDFIKVKPTAQGRIGYICELCQAESNAKVSLELHCNGMKHLKKKDVWEKSQKQQVSDMNTGTAADDKSFKAKFSTRRGREDEFLLQQKGPYSHEADKSDAAYYRSYKRSRSPEGRYNPHKFERKEPMDTYNRNDSNYPYRNERNEPNYPYKGGRNDPNYHPPPYNTEGNGTRGPGPYKSYPQDHRDPYRREPRKSMVEERRETPHNYYNSKINSRSDQFESRGQPVDVSKRNDVLPNRFREDYYEREKEHSMKTTSASHFEVSAILANSRAPSPPKVSLKASPAGTLLEKLAKCSVKTEEDSTLALNVLASLIKSLKEYNLQKGDLKNTELLIEAELKVGTVKALSSLSDSKPSLQVNETPSYTLSQSAEYFTPGISAPYSMPQGGMF